ncbi:MAG: hypothetical protein JWN76_1808 [Chitinophagaceae bacterium]|nr:hypothetical protein [Chitinophagaceae bacterium]
MKPKLLNPRVLLTLFILLVFASCQKNDVYESNTFYGPEVKMGNGKARSFATIERFTNKPLAIGFELDKNALVNLPAGQTDGIEEVEYLLPLHQKAAESTLFTHLIANWNPHGHFPGPYLLPHFDFHCYMLSESVRKNITADDPKSVQPIPDGYLPPTYIGPLGPEPQMGGHCVDVTSPELNGSQFTQTFVYGAYNGKVAFYEPMITYDFLRGIAQQSFAIKQPQKFSAAGYYPTQYSITKSADGKIYVSLEGFVKRVAN